ncbi:MAG: PqqD family protein [Candidatus Binataceae bacterium]
MADSREPVISTDSFVVAVRDQVSCDLKGEAAILNLKSGIYFGLDEVGATVWSMLAEPRRVAELCDALVEQYEVDPARCAGDLIRLLGDLARHGLIDVTGSR